MTSPKMSLTFITMADNEKKSLKWWLELARAILAAIAGLLGSQASAIF